MRNARHCYTHHRIHARARGIPFLLTFEQWWEIWKRSRRWHLRGRGRGRYHMSRIADRGGYTLGNVRIVLHETNRREQRMSDATRAKIAAAHRGRHPSEETRAKMRAADRRRFRSGHVVRCPVTGRFEKGRVASSTARPIMDVNIQLDRRRRSD